MSAKKPAPLRKVTGTTYWHGLRETLECGHSFYVGSYLPAKGGVKKASSRRCLGCLHSRPTTAQAEEQRMSADVGLSTEQKKLNDEAAAREKKLQRLRDLAHAVRTAPDVPLHAPSQARELARLVMELGL